MLRAKSLKINIGKFEEIHDAFFVFQRKWMEATYLIPLLLIGRLVCGIFLQNLFFC